MSYTIILTAYQPGFTPEFKNWIKKNISPAMVNANLEDEEASYFLDTIMEESLLMSPEDYALLTELQLQNIEYVEF